MSEGASLTRREAAAGLATCWLAGSCSRAMPPPPGPLNVRGPSFPLLRASGARHLIDSAGAPFMLHGDTAWALIADLPRDDVLRYLDDRAARGFNAVLVSLLERKFSRHAPANFYGERPFTAEDDYSTPNEAYFAHADWVLGEAQERGLLALLTPSYTGFAGSDEGWYAVMVANGEARMRAYGRFIAERFGGRRNIMWVHAGDDNPPNRDIVRAIALGIREVDSVSLHTAHSRPDSTALEHWPDEDWLSVNTVYTRSRIYDACAREYRRPQRMPVFFIEGTYENESYGGPIPEEDGLRRQAYHAVLSGAFGHVFGNNPIWHFEGPGLFRAPSDWRGALASRGAQSMTLLRMILSQANWPLLEPDLGQEFLTSGLGQGEERAVAAVASDRRTAVVYVPARRRIGVDPRRLEGPDLAFRWLDPSSGASLAVEEAPPAAGVFELAPPGRNAAGYGDWVLLAESS